MCLDRKFTAEERKQYLKKRGRFFKVYKIVRKDNLGNYQPVCYFNTFLAHFCAGLNIDTTTRKCVSMDNGRYPTGFHAYTTRKGASAWLSSYRYIVACYVRSSWVHTVGKQGDEKVIVTKKIIMPARFWEEPSQSLLKKALRSKQ